MLVSWDRDIHPAMAHMFSYHPILLFHEIPLLQNWQNQNQNPNFRNLAHNVFRLPYITSLLRLICNYVF